ncbi:MAG: hybrid sensor histidine kinase/response regulator [Anaerolineae bacterium]
MTTILVIEDQLDLREDVVEHLMLEGFDAFGAENGRIGVQLAQKYMPSLIISDIMMPELDGYGVLNELRSDATTASIPFIFLTARVNRNDLRKGMELGADDYVTKPFSHTELLASVNTVLVKQEALRARYGKQADDLRQNLLQSLPHELRTPLTGILGYGEMLADDCERLRPDQIRRMAEDIVKSGNRLYHVIENFLLYAQIEIMKTDPVRADKMRTGRTENAGYSIIRAAEKAASRMERLEDLRLSVQNAEVGVSEDSLEKIVEEIVDNAFKFSNSGTPVEVRTAINKGIYFISICDQGRGFTADQLRNVGSYMQFERKLYEQQGLGLGLMLSKTLSELHGGRLTLLSEAGAGTQVDIELPI